MQKKSNVNWDLLPHDLSIILNILGNLNIKKLLTKNCKVLIGPKYCLLNQNYKSKKPNKIKPNKGEANL